MKQIKSIKGERHIHLNWEGAYVLKDGHLAVHPLENHALPPDAPGLYMALGDYPLKGPRTLIYIGRTDRFISKRIQEHKWLSYEWRVEIYTTVVEDPIALVDAEKLLIYAHTPVANSKSIQDLSITSPLRIWNSGRFWGLFPEVSSEHEWISGRWYT